MRHLTPSDELSFVKDYMILSLLKIKIERDMTIISKIKELKLNKPYIDALHKHGLDKVNADLANARTAFRKHNIQLYNESSNEQLIMCKYSCRGYHHDFEILWAVAQSEIEIKLRSYLLGDLLYPYD